MNITRENIDELNGIIRVVIEKEDYEATVEDVLKDYRKKVNMPGFRAGKVPAGLVRKMYGKTALGEEVNNLLTKQLSKYLVEEKLNILGEPIPNDVLQKPIDWENDSTFEFVFDIGFAPAIKLSLDKKSKYIAHKIAVSEEMINQQIEAYTSRFGETKDTDVVEETGTIRGNISQLDSNGNLMEDGSHAEMALISIDIIKDEAIKNLFVGKKIEEEVVFDIKKAYPNNTEIGYLLNIDKEKAAAIDGDFKILIKEIHKFVPGEVNPELFKKIYGEETNITDEEAFRAKVIEEIEQAYVPSSEYKFAIDARDNLVAKSNLEFPVEFLKRWLKLTNKELSKEQIDNDFDYFLTDLKWQVIKEEIIKENELKVSEEDIKEMARDVAKMQFRQYGMFDIPAEHLEGFVKQMLSKEEDRNRLYSKKMEDKIMDVIKSKVNVEVKEVSKEDFDKFFENK